MGAFHKLIASVKSALDRTPPAPPPAHHTGLPPLPITPIMRRTELGAEFAREFGEVGGHFLGVFGPGEAITRALSLAKELQVRRIAIGAGVALDEGPLARALEHAGLEVTDYRYAGANASQGLADHIAQCDLGIIEAHFAIAATGTFMVVGERERPLSLSLLPPVNLLLVHAGRLVPDLAAAISALGKDRVIAHRVALITGPSRTADIEKMIVIGVHGPKQVYAMIIWPGPT